MKCASDGWSAKPQTIIFGYKNFIFYFYFNEFYINLKHYDSIIIYEGGQSGFLKPVFGIRKLLWALKLSAQWYTKWKPK